MPMEVMGLMLGEFVDEYTVRVVDVFAMPQSGTGVSVEAVDHVFQTNMLDMLKQTGRFLFFFFILFPIMCCLSQAVAELENFPWEGRSKFFSGNTLNGRAEINFFSENTHEIANKYTNVLAPRGAGTLPCPHIAPPMVTGITSCVKVSILTNKNGSWQLFMLLPHGHNIIDNIYFFTLNTMDVCKDI